MFRMDMISTGLDEGAAGPGAPTLVAVILIDGAPRMTTYQALLQQGGGGPTPFTLTVTGAPLSDSPAYLRGA